MLDKIAEDVALLILHSMDTKLRLRLSVISKAYKQLVQESFHSEIVLDCTESQASKAFGWLNGAVANAEYSLESFKLVGHCPRGMLCLSGHARSEIITTYVANWVFCNTSLFIRDQILLDSPATDVLTATMHNLPGPFWSLQFDDYSITEHASCKYFEGRHKKQYGTRLSSLDTLDYMHLEVANFEYFEHLEHLFNQCMNQTETGSSPRHINCLWKLATFCQAWDV